MRILFFDDEERRYKAIKKKSERCVIDWAASVEEFAQMLAENEPYEVASLDHDIGGQMLDCSKNCGCCTVPVLKAMAPTKAPTLVIVHSWNPDASTRMMGLLDGEGIWQTIRAPFGSFWFKDKEVTIRD